MTCRPPHTIEVRHNGQLHTEPAALTPGLDFIRAATGGDGMLLPQPADAVHCVAARVLAEAGVAALAIKGPATARLLYEDSVRRYADADVLVAPGQFDVALSALSLSGFRSREIGFHAFERTEHSDTLIHPELPAALDLHRTFPGLEAPPDSSWAALWQRRVTLPLGDTNVWTLDTAGCALLIAVHAARNGYGTSLSSTDLRRALARLDKASWADAFELASQCDALEALVAGLRFLPAGRALTAEFAPGVYISNSWSAAQSESAVSIQRWQRASKLPRKQRLTFLLEELLPSQAFMRQGWPQARRGRLALAHLQRWLHLLFGLPKFIHDLRRERH